MSIEAQLEWDKQQLRAITQASGNMGVIKKYAFYTLHSVKELWGKAAMIEFKEWFEARRHDNQEVADKLLTKRDEKAKRMKAKPNATLAADLIKLEQKFQKLMMTKAYVWVWSIKSEKQRTAWELTRGFGPFAPRRPDPCLPEAVQECNERERADEHHYVQKKEHPGHSTLNVRDWTI